ncbi:F192A protein, partial [Galbula dea]|nr:F192A protein [Galbula dea]
MDGGDGTADLVINKRFVSESELEERRKRRQEEWEKVRKPEDPEECPEEAYDPRSLYERLQEQREKKQQEFEEQFKFKNMVRGLDEDETHFLDEVSRQQELLEKQRREEELKELNEYRISFAFKWLVLVERGGETGLTLAKVGVSMDPKKETEKKLPMKSVENKNKFSQAKLLAGAVKHRSSDGGNSVKRLKLDTDQDEKNQEKASCVALGSSSGGGSAVHCPSAAVCIGILPGLGAYSGSSDSESSSDSEGTISSTGKIVSSVFRSNSFFDGP